MINKKNNIQYNKFVCEFYRTLNEKSKLLSNLVFLCIGTDRITGDCFGPIVGDKLKKNMKDINIMLPIYGSLDDPIVESNSEKIIHEIYKKNDNPFIIAVDAALSKEENIGKIFVTSQSLKLGKGLEKNITQIGNMSIKAVVGKKHKNNKKNMEILQNTSLNMVMNLARIVTDGITYVLKEEYK